MIPRLEGKQLGPYEVRERIGQGGMAAVFRGYQPSMDRTVAIKVLPPQAAEDPRFAERFSREAKTIARLEHRSILPVYDFGEQDGIFYLVMRYLDGGTLKEVLEEGRPHLDDITSVIAQVSEALDYAHRRGVIHRDVKPANIMIDDESAVYLTDFGISKVIEGATLTEDGMAVGTPAYMAPEQGLGQTVDARTDIYALGVVLYEMVTGRVPYQADTPVATALAHIREPLPPPRDFVPEVPPAVEAVIIRALAKEPKDRYQTAVELSHALDEAAAQSTSSGFDAGETAGTLRVLLENARTTQQMKAVQPHTVRHDSPVPPPARQSPGATVAEKVGVPRSIRPLGFIIVGLILFGIIAGGLGLLFGGEGDDGDPDVVLDDGGAQDGTVDDPDTGGGGDDGGSTAAGDVVYDDFENEAFDGRVDPFLWEADTAEGCTIAQEEGFLAFIVTPFDQYLTCNLILLRPEVIPANEFEAFGAVIAVEVAEGFDAGTGLTLFNQFDADDSFQATCGISRSDQDEGVVAFYVVTDTRPNPDFVDEMRFYDEVPVGVGETVELLLTTDASGDALLCLLNGEPLGSYAIPPDDEELRTGDLVRLLSGWASEGAAIITTVEEVITGFPTEPEPESDGSSPVLFDEFEEAAFEGAYNADFWRLAQNTGEACVFEQQAGVLLATQTADPPDNTYCGLRLQQEWAAVGPPLVLDTIIIPQPDHNQQGFTAGGLHVLHETEAGYTEAVCGVFAGGDTPNVRLSVTDTVSGEDFLTADENAPPADYDQPVEVVMVVDPSSYTLGCYADGEIVSEYRLNRAGELRGVPWEVGLHTYWGDGARISYEMQKFYAGE